MKKIKHFLFLLFFLLHTLANARVLVPVAKIEVCFVSAGATQISKAYGAKKLSYGEHKALHAFVGGVTGAILNPADLGKGALSGALGAFVAETIQRGAFQDLMDVLPQTIAKAT